jgi:CelD/BcsL family acetyltransferase involved in cellulose biosynthesis
MDDLAAAQQIVSAWNELLERSLCNPTFSSPTWYLAACRTEPELTPWLALAWRGGDLAGVLPIAVRPATQEAIFPNAMSDYNDLVVADGDDEVAAGLLEMTLLESGRFRRVEFHKVRQDSNLIAGLVLLEVRCQFTVQRFPNVEASYIELPGTRADFLASRSRKFRKGATTALRKAAADGIDLRELTPGNFPAERITELFFNLNFSRFGDRSAFRCEARNSAFAEHALPKLFAERRLHVFVMQRAEQVMAIDLNFRGLRSLCLWNGGFLPEAACWSPGKLLLLFGIQRAIELGLDEVDLLRGTQEWKAGWINGRRRLEKIVIEL